MKRDRLVYYISARPEAYEIWGEVGHEEAQQLARVIATRAGAHYPNIEFRVDDQWHHHAPGMAAVAAYIDRHWQTWADKAHVPLMSA